MAQRAPSNLLSQSAELPENKVQSGEGSAETVQNGGDSPDQNPTNKDFVLKKNIVTSLRFESAGNIVMIEGTNQDGYDQTNLRKKGSETQENLKWTLQDNMRCSADVVINESYAQESLNFQKSIIDKKNIETKDFIIEDTKFISQ